MIMKLLVRCLYGILFLTAILRLCGTISFNTVIGESMLPNYAPNDYIVTWKDSLGGISRGDVVVAKSPTGKLVIKRVIGTPFDAVSIKNSKVYINGKLMEEEYINEKFNQNKENMDEVVLGEDEYFILGDNRDVSMDSRNYGPIKASDIKGELLFDLELSKFSKTE